METKVDMIESVQYKLSLDLSYRPAANSQICKKLISLTDDAYCTIKLFQGIFIHQPGMVANVIRLANASGLKKPVLTLSESIAVLGWKKVRGIISSIALQAAVKEKNQILDRVWEQCTLRTLLCRLLSHENEEEEKLCYFLGFSRFQLALKESQKYLEVIELLKVGCGLNEAEQAKFGTISTSLSASLCESSKLPEYFKNSIELYDRNNTKNKNFECIALSERISVLMLYQESELANFVAKLEFKNIDKTILTAKKELENIKKMSGF